MNTEEQQFLNALDKRLWDAADRLRSNVNPSDYMHVVLGLVFLKYVASMNMAIRGLDFDFGKEPASTYTRPQHPDLRADFVMANPPFNMKAWKEGAKEDDPRWKYEYGVPPDGNANFAWMQHMVHHLTPHGSRALLLANGSMSSNTNTEGKIRKAIVEATLDDIRKSDHVLTPGRYVGAAAQEEDGEPFEDKMACLTAALGEQFRESARLEAEIRKNLAGLGYAV